MVNDEPASLTDASLHVVGTKALLRALWRVHPKALRMASHLATQPRATKHELIEAVWGDDPDGGPVTANVAIRVYATQLRRVGFPFKYEHTRRHRLKTGELVERERRRRLDDTNARKAAAIVAQIDQLMPLQAAVQDAITNNAVIRDLRLYCAYPDGHTVATTVGTLGPDSSAQALKLAAAIYQAELDDLKKQLAAI